MKEAPVRLRKPLLPNLVDSNLMRGTNVGALRLYKSRKAEVQAVNQGITDRPPANRLKQLTGPKTLEKRGQWRGK